MGIYGLAVRRHSLQFMTSPLASQAKRDAVAFLSDVRKIEHVRTLGCEPSACQGGIILGENLSVLSELRERIRGEVKCIYIDPPYNNGEVYNHYRDDFGHTVWLKHATDRLAALHPLLREDGSIWISIDDGEVHYLKVAADRVFGRHNFVATVAWEHRTTRENRRAFSFNHEYILVYAKSAAAFKKSRNKLPSGPEVRSRYKNVDNDPRGPWQSVSLNVQDGHATAGQFYELIAPNGKPHRPPRGRCWALSKERMEAAIARGEIWFGADGNGVPRRKLFLAEAQHGLTPPTLWTASDVGTTLSAKRHLLQLFGDGQPFETPKPEALVRRILEIASDPGDLVLDAYLGSGTTAAVAHKIDRRYLGIEESLQSARLAARRLSKVIAGEQGGISKDVRWLGGGSCSLFKWSD